MYVTTEYGKELLPGQNNVHIHVGKMDEGQMSDEISVILPDIVIDATHPYACLLYTSVYSNAVEYAFCLCYSTCRPDIVCGDSSSAYYKIIT